MKRDLETYEGLPAGLVADDEPSGLDLPATYTAAAVLRARSRQAVRFSGEVFLPAWPDGTVGLPTVLLRSALWAAGDCDDLPVKDVPITTLEDDVRVLFSGRPLMQYDRRVFAGCLELFKDKPLSSGDQQEPASRSTFYELARAMGNAYTLNTHIAIRASLLRLRQAAVQVRIRSEVHIVASLLAVRFHGTAETAQHHELQGADELEIRIPEDVAVLYGLRSWTAVPKPVLEMKALRGWLCGILATPAMVETLDFEVLHDLSALRCRPNDFRRRVCDALDELQAADVPLAYRVGGFEVTADKKWLTVRMARWG